MASDLLSIAASGARAARGALDVTAHNIANAASEGYVRRSLNLAEVSSAGGLLRMGDVSLSGVRIASIHRNADLFRYAELCRTGSDLARATAELGGLESIESAVEQSGLYSAIVEFEGALKQLATDPVDGSLRANALASADQVARTFNIAASGLSATGDGLRFNASAAVDEANVVGGELARVNVRLARAGAGSSERATLLDQRDQLVQRLSGIADITTSYSATGAVTVTVGGTGSAPFVTGNTAGTLSVSNAPDGTLGFSLDGTALTISGGALGGHALALGKVGQIQAQLDTLAAGIASMVNTVQANGAALDGTAGQPLFAGNTAATITLALTDGGGLATAPAGAAAGSLDPSNLAALRSALDATGTASGANQLLFDISSQIAGRRVTRDALDAISSSARIAFEQQAGVDLDTEAANLIRFQQAFQASGRAMQVASDIFDTLIGIG